MVNLYNPGLLGNFTPTPYALLVVPIIQSRLKIAENSIRDNVYFTHSYPKPKKLPNKPNDSKRKLCSKNQTLKFPDRTFLFTRIKRTIIINFHALKPNAPPAAAVRGLLVLIFAYLYHL
jgi:hypothetical protein